jgi:hypothetical protein
MLHNTTRRRRHRYDPMREIDQMLLEDAMLRHNVETTRTIAYLRTGALLAVLLGVVVILAHSMMYGDRTVTAAKGPHLEQGHNAQLDERWFW